MSKDRANPFAAVGGSSLLVIFAVLSLMIFAMLSLSTVLSQRRLAEASLQSVTNYYAADLEAETIFARLRAGEAAGEVSREGSRYTYQCAASEHQILIVELEREEEGWRVLRWQLTAQPLQIQETLPVFQGG